MRLAACLLSVAGASLVATCRLQDLVNPGKIHSLELAPAALVDSAKAGSISPRVTKLSLQLGSEGVAWSVKSVLGSAWLRPAATSGTAPDTVSVALDASALSGGIYRDTLVFSVASLAVSPVSVPVEFHVMGCTGATLVTGTTVSDSLVASDCAAPHRAGRLAKLYTLTGNANDSISLRLIPTGFLPYLVLDSASALGGVPSFVEGATCRAGQRGACLTYVRLPHAGTYQVEATSASGTASTGPFTLSLTAPQPPVPPDTLTQVSSDGLTIVPPGGTVTQDTIDLRAFVADPDSDSVRVQIEVRPLATAFTGAPTDTSTWVPSGGRAVAAVTGLANFASYHWQARTLDRTGRTSAWVAFAGGTSGFRLNVPQPPNSPASLAQFKSNGTTAIAVGGATNESAVLLRGVVTDPDTTLQLRLDVEVEPVGTAFTNVATASSTPVGNGKVATATVANLKDNTAYHWQARAVDQGGHAGAWVSFGGNAESAADFTVAIPPSQLAILVQPAGDTSGRPVYPAVRVAAQDALGDTLTSFTGTISAALAGGPTGGTLSGTTSVAAVAGIATFANLLTDKAGTGYTLRFTAGALSVTTSTFATVPGAASTAASVVTVSSASVASGSAVTLTLQAKDAAGNNLTAGGSAVVFTATGGTSTGTIGATVDSANGKYVASFTGLAAGTATTIHATIGGAAVTSTATLTVTPGPVSTSQSLVTTSSGIVASGVAATLTLQAKDAAGNNLTAGGLTVAFTASGGTSTGTIAATTDNANGTYTTSFTGVTAGTPDTIHATIGGVAVTSALPTIQVTSSSTVSAAQTTVVAAPASITASTGTSATTITVTAKDAAGNPVSGVMVTLAATGTGNTIVQPVGATNASGVATGTFSSTASGPHTIQANAGGVLATQQPVVTVTAAAPASLAFLVQPVNVAAGAAIAPPVQVEVLDVFGNLATAASGTISLALTVPAGATLTGGGPATVTSGVATFAALSVNRTGTYSLTPTTTVGGVATLPASTSFTVSTATASQLAWTQQPGNVVAGATMTPAVTVTVEDAQGNVVTTASGTVTLTLTGSPAGVTLTGGGAATVTNGVATFSGLSINKTGSFTFTPTTTVSGVTTLPASASFAVTPGAATQLVWSQQPSAVLAGATMAPAVTVTVQDANGNTVTGASGTVTLGLTGSPAGVTLTGGGAAAVASGVATFAGLSVNKTGTFSLTPTTTVTGVTTLPASGTFAVSPGAATQLGFTTQPSAVAAGATITPAVVVAVQDANGNTVPTATNSITIAIGTNPGGGTLSGTATGTAVAGVATFSTLSINKVGTGYTLTAAATGLTTGTSAAFNVTVGGATQLGFTTQPSAVVAGVAIAPAVVVAVQDALGNTVTTATNSITIAIGTNPGGGTLSGTVTAPAVNGVASFPTLNINKTGTGYTLTAGATGLTTGTSAAFNVTPAATTKLAFTTQPPSTTAGTAFTVVVTAQDALGNTATGFTGTDTVAIGTNPGGGTLSGTAIVASASGVATFSGLSIDKAGAGYTLTAKSGTLTTATSNAFTITTGGVISASQSTVTASAATLTASSGTITDTITVTVKDAQGNPIPNVTVSLSATGTSNLVQPSGPTGANGVATGTFSSTAAGSHTITATAGGVVITQAPAVTVNAAAPAALAYSVQPSNVAAGAAITPAVRIQVLDAFANPVTTATNSIAVGLFNNPSGGTLSGTTTVAAVAGVASFSTLSIDKTGIGYTLAATSSGLTGAVSGAFDVTAAVATKLAFTTQPATVAATAAITPAVVVTVQDAAGNTVTTATNSITVAIGANPGGGTLAGTVTVPAVAGVASFSTLSINKTGTGYTLTAAATGLTGATSSTFNVTPGAATQLIVTTQPPASTVAGSAFGLVVTAQDASGNTATAFTGSVTVAIGTNPGGGTLSGTATVTAVAGVATFSGLSINKPGTGYTLTAAASGLTGATSSAFNITVGTATQLAVTTQPPGSTAAGSAFGLVVTAQDGSGNTATTFAGSVTVAIGANPGGGTLSGTATVTAVAGVATFSGLSINKVGTGYTLTAAASGLTGTTTSAFTVAAGTAAQLAFTTQPSNATAGTAIAPAVVVAVQDALGNTVTSANNSVTVAIGTNPGGGTLSGTLTASAVSGLATFSTLSINKVGTGYTLSATSTGLATGTSSAFNITPGSATQLVWTQQPSAVAAGATMTPAVTVTVEDADGNTVTSASGTVTLALAVPGGATLTGGGPATVASGVATFGSLSVNKAGTYNFTPTTTVSGVTTLPQSSSFSVGTGGATQLVWSQQPTNVLAGATMIPAVTVTVEDGQGNVVTGAIGTVTLALTAPGGATLTGGGPATVTSGVATFSGLSVNKIGTYTFTPSTTVGGVTALPASGSFAVSPGAATQLVWTQQPSAVAAGATMSPAVTVTVEDANGNTVTSASGTVTLALTLPGGATLTGGGPATVASGVATFGSLSVNKAGSYTFTPTTTVSGVTTLPASGGFTVSSGSISASQSTVTVASGTLTASSGSITDAVTVTVRDAQGNAIQGVTVSLSATGTANLVQPSAPTDASGVATGTFSSTAAGTHTITATAGGVVLTQQPVVTVTAAAAASVAYGVQPSNVVSAVAISPAVQVAVVDAFNNVVTSATNNITVALFNNPGGGTLSGTLTQAAASGVATFSNLSIDKVGTGYTLSATGAGVPGGAISNGFNVTPAAAASLAVTGLATASAGTAQSITVTAKDAHGNTATGYLGTVHFTSTDGQAVLPANYTFVVGDAGVHTFSGGVTLKTAGSRTVTGTDNVTSSITGGQTVTVNPAGAASLVLSGLTSTTAGTAQSLTVTARDAFSNTATGYVGTVHFTSTDGQALLPGDYTFVTGDAGVHTFTGGVTLKTAGSQTVTGTDNVTGSITGGQTVTISAGAAFKLAITIQPSSAGTSGIAFPQQPVIQLQDAFGNPVSTSGVSVTAALNSGTGTLDGVNNPVATSAAGTATFTDLAITGTGAFTLIFTSGTLASVVSTTINQ